MNNLETGHGSLVLKRETRIYCWHVLGEVARATPRPELLPVLQRAAVKELVDELDIAEHLFCEASRKFAARRLLEIARGLGLLQEQEPSYGAREKRRCFSLTELGREALQREQVFVPEHASWRLWASDDPLLECPVLRIEEVKEPRAGKQVHNKDAPAVEKLPAWLRKALRQTITPLGHKQALRIEQLGNSLQPQIAEATLIATWDVDEHRLQFHGKLGDTSIDAPGSPPTHTVQQAWKDLLQSAGLLEDWDAETLALKKSFDDCKESERNSLQADLHFDAPQLQGLGRFDAMTVNRVALMPRSTVDAQRWARWRLLAGINHYASAERFENWVVQAYAPFQAFGLATPSRKELAENVWQQRDNNRATTTWHLVAAEDWGL